MKFTVNNQDLLKKLQFLGTIVNSSIPTLDNFHFEFLPNEIQITTTDLETTIRTKIKGNFDSHPAVLIPAKLFVDVLKSFPNQPIEFEINKNNTISMRTTTGAYEISYADGTAFPQLVVIENPQSVALPARGLAVAISNTIFATSNDDLRPMLTGVCFQLTTNGVIFAATDGHRLVKYSRIDVVADQDAEFIVPKKPLAALKSILATIEGDVAIEYNETNTVFIFDEYFVSVRLIDAKYPAYNNVIPKDNDKVLVIDKDLLANSVRRISTFASRSTPQVKFRIAGQELNISAEDIDYSNRGDERLTCSFEGTDIQIGFNSRFLAEVLGNLHCKEIRLELSTEVRAGVIHPVDGLEEGEELLMLVMPVKIN